jgi:hypothetical protein
VRPPSEGDDIAVLRGDEVHGVGPRVGPALTGWPEESIRRNCHDGKYEHIRRGRYYFMTRAQIDAMIEAHRQCRKPVEVDPVQAARQANIVRLRN